MELFLNSRNFLFIVSIVAKEAKWNVPPEQGSSPHHMI